MGGNGEGVVAIVQGLRDAGLAVTLIGRVQRRTSATALKQSRQVTHAKSTVETSTSALPAATSLDTAAQICDDRYTSSYQLAHCRARPSSPPVELAEFPPQRLEPCRTQGNFEVGGVGSGEAKAPTHMSASQSQPLRDSFSSVDRGLLSNRSSRGTEAFVHSLRKYPSISPNKSISPNTSISTDLVQRLLAYTQAKNFSKSSYHTKSMRSLRAKTESPKEITSKTKSSKSVQTYARTKVKASPVPKGEERGKENVKEEKQKQKRTQWPVKSERDVRYKDDRLNATYDYLKSAKRFSRATDVQYLSEVTRCLRDTLRQICDDQPVMCPSIQNRYSKHRRDHHRQGMGHRSSSDSNNTQPRASLPTVSTGVPAMSPCPAMQRTCQGTCPSRPKTCCLCHKPLPCSCPQRSSVQFQRLPKIISKSNFFARFLSNDEILCKCSGSSLDDFEKDLKEQVYNWLQEIPVYANDKPEDKRMREEMADNLVEKLKGMKDDKDFEEKAKAEIAECVNNMPMWCPGNEESQDLFKQEIADNLLNKIRDISKKVDKFEKEILKWIDGLNLKSRDSQGQVIDKQSVADNLVNRLKPLALNQPEDVEEYKEDLKKEIVDVLEELPIEVDGDKQTYLNDQADQLATQLYTIPPKDISKRSSEESLEDEFQKQIWEWLKDVPEFSSPTASKEGENQESVKALANTLQKLQAQGIDDTGVQDQMQNEINEWLETNVGEKNRLDPETKDKLAEKLLEKLINTSKSAAMKKAKKPLSEDNITQQIWDWVNDIPELSGVNKNDKTIEQLAKKLLELRSQGRDDSELEDEISNWLKTAFEKKGQWLDVRNQDKLVDKLLSKIKTLTNEKGDGQLIQELKNCFEDTPELDMNSKVSKKMVEQLANKIQELQSSKPGNVSDEEMKEKISNWLDDLIKLLLAKINTKTKNQLIQKLMNTAKSPPKQRKRWSKQDNLQKSISDGISSILEGSSLKLANGNKKDLQNKISHLLSRNIDEVKSGDESGEIKAEIVDILEQDAQIPTGKANKVADDIIHTVQSMTLPDPSIGIQSDQLKNSIKEEVNRILDESNVHCDNRDEIEPVLTEVIVDQVMRGENDKQTKDKLISALEDSDISKDQIQEIASELVRMGKEVSLNQKTRDSTMPFEGLSPMQKEKFQDNVEQEIVEFVEEMTGDSSAPSVKKYKAAAEKMAERVGDIMSDKNTTIADKRKGIESEVSKGLRSLSISTDGSEPSQLADKLQNLAIKTSTPKKSPLAMRKSREFEALSPIQKEMFQDNAEQEIVEFVKEMTGDSSAPSVKKYKAAAEKMAERVGDIMSDKNTTIADKRKGIESEVSKGLKSLSISIDRSEPRQLADKLQNLAVETSTPRRSSLTTVQPREFEALSPMQKEMFQDTAEQEIVEFVKEMTGDSSAPSEKKYKAAAEKMAEKVGDIMSDKHTTIADKRKGIENEVSKGLKSLSISANGFEPSQLADKLQNLAVETSTPRRSSLATGKSREFEALSPMQKEMFQDTAEQEIVEFVKEMTGDSSAPSEKKYKAAAEKMAEKVGDIMSDKNTTIADKRKGIENEVSKGLRSLSISTDGSEPSQLADKLQNLAIKTSTPRKSSLARRFSFRPRRDSTMSTIDDASQSPSGPSPQEKQYMDKLVKRIDSWMSGLPVDLNTEEGKGFKEVMTKDLAGDIIDRQKYLQLNPDAKTSDEEELEHLKYQVFRWLNKLPGVKDLMPSIAKTDYLMERIKAVPVPQLIKTKDRKFSQQRDSNVQHLSQDLSSLQNEISKWIEAVPSKFYATSDKDDRQHMVKNLAQQIDQLQREEALTETLFDDVVSEWLQKILKEFNEQYFSSLTEGLKNVLLNKGLISLLDQSMLASPNRQDRIEEILPVLEEWIESLPLQVRKTSAEKKKLENLKQELAENIQQIKQQHPVPNESTSKCLKEEIKNCLQKFPIEPAKKKDEQFLSNKIDKLHEMLIGVEPQMTKSNDRPSKSVAGVDEILPVLDVWIDSLPLQARKTSAENKKLDNLKQELAENIQQINQQHPAPNERTSEVLKEEIKNYLQKLPIEPAKKKDEQFVSNKVDELQEMLLDVQPQMKNNNKRPSGSVAGVQEILPVLEEWIDSLPLQVRRTSAENKKLNNLIQEFAETIQQVNQQHSFPDKRASKCLKDEIKDYMQKLPIDPAKIKDDQFVSNKIDELQKMLIDVQSQMKNNNERPSRSVAGVQEILPVLEEWIDSLPLQVRRTSAENKKLNNLIQDFAETVQQVNQQHPFPDKRASKCLKEEIKDYLQKFPIDPANKKDEQFVSNKIDELHEMLRDLQSQMKNNNKRPSISVEGVKEVIQNWAKKLPFQPGQSIEKSKPEVDKIAPKIKDIVSNVPVDGVDKVKDNLEKEIKTFVKKLPLQMNKLKDDHVKELTDQLHDLVKTPTATRPGMANTSSFSSKYSPKKAADVLYDNIEDWCENLPIQSGNTPEEKEKVKTLKQNIASKLINIVGELNMNPEIFNDDVLYEDLLKNEIDDPLSTLPPSPELEQQLPGLKENLIEKVMEAKIKTQDELAGQAYKQQLRDTISKTLPPLGNLSTEEQAPFEVLKDNLADAYINLHHAASNEDTKRKLKGRISDEIDQFCNDYLERYPEMPVDPIKLNSELYHALQKVPVPKDETIKSQVEQVRIKDEINDWLQENPLKEDQSPTEQLQTNKVVNVLAKRLHDIEKEKEYNPDVDVEDKMKKEIKKWINKLPIQPAEEDEVEEIVEQLTSKLKNTEESRRFSVSKIRHSMDTADDQRTCETVCPFYYQSENPAMPAYQPTLPTGNSHLSQYAPSFPPSTLSPEDRAHLERIRERNQPKQQSGHICKDVYVNPIPIDAGSQTDVVPGASSGGAKSMQPQSKPCSPCSPCAGQSPPTQSPDSVPYLQAPVSPHVLVKEYHWDSPNNSSTMHEPGYAAPSGQQGQPASFRGQNPPCCQQCPPGSYQDQNQTYGQQPQQFSWPQSQVNLPPSFGVAQQPSPYAEPGQFPSPDQSRMAQSPGMISPPAMSMQPPYMQQPRPPQSPSMSPTSQMPSQAPYIPQPQSRPCQSPCMSQQSSMQPQDSRTQPPYPSVPPYTGQQSPSMPPQSPCMMSKQSLPPQMRSPYMNQPQMPEARSPYMTPYDRTPCMTTPQVSQRQMPPCQAHETPRQRFQPSQHTPCHSQENTRRGNRKPWRPPCFGFHDRSSTSSPFDTGPDADISRFGPKVTRLGSLDDVPCTKTCGSQSPRAKRSRGSPDEDYDWKIRFPEGEHFWGTPCSRRRVHRTPIRSSDGPFIKEKERKKEKVRCRCEERVLTKCMGRRPQLDDDSMNHCSKCCGAHCPHPSYLFFK